MAINNQVNDRYNPAGVNSIDFEEFKFGDLEVGELEDVSKSLLYDKAFNYIKKIDLKDKHHLKILAEQASRQLKTSLNKAIEYHEDREEYEKCALLKQYLDFISFSSYLNNK